MRVLITSPAGLGHIHPMVPLARALRDRRHEVLWAVPADGVDHVERAGLRAVASAPAGLTRVRRAHRGGRTRRTPDPERYWRRLPQVFRNCAYRRARTNS
ncbi:MAG TPA: hypothetical protein VN748_02575 [Pseudonocardiaceae bacterium]|jgi:UDP:flavonoid glycosyltransferase YjiC (YdhE family)|nr:hypothetical protein [Pseudonocardiaceae bacterium]